MTNIKVEQDTMLESEGWILRRLKGYGIEEDGSNCWAEHDCLATERVRGGHGKSFYGWFPRDNAYFGACCYCGAGCPDEIRGIYLMLNADLFYAWNPDPWARCSPDQVSPKRERRD